MNTYWNHYFFYELHHLTAADAIAPVPVWIWIFVAVLVISFIAFIIWTIKN